MALLMHSGTAAKDLWMVCAATSSMSVTWRHPRPREYEYIYTEARIRRDSWRFVLVCANVVFGALLAAVLNGWIK